MELHLVPGLRGASGDGGDPDRLSEAEHLLRRTRQRLEELAERLAEIRRQLGPVDYGRGAPLEADDKTDPFGPDTQLSPFDLTRFSE